MSERLPYVAADARFLGVLRDRGAQLVADVVGRVVWFADAVYTNARPQEALVDKAVDYDLLPVPPQGEPLTKTALGLAGEGVARFLVGLRRSINTTRSTFANVQEAAHDLDDWPIRQ